MIWLAFVRQISKNKFKILKKMEFSSQDPSSHPFTNKLSNFSWIEFTKQDTDINYLQKFLSQSKSTQIDYKALDLQKIDPTQASGSGFSFDISSMENRIQKWGKLNLKKSKKSDDKEYDLDDSFIDDASDNQEAEHKPTEKHLNLGAFVSVTEDFICIRGDIQKFKESEYYKQRIEAMGGQVKKTPEQTDKPKKKKVLPKLKESSDKKTNVTDSTGNKRRKRNSQEIMINKRNSDDLKKLKLTPHDEKNKEIEKYLPSDSEESSSSKTHSIQDSVTKNSQNSTSVDLSE